MSTTAHANSDTTSPHRMTEIQQQALSNAVSNQSTMNYGAIFDGFIEKGIPADDIRPRENVFTFHAWKALGRQVRKGEHGVKVVTWITCKTADKAAGSDQSKEGNEPGSYKRPKTTTVFHVSQTDAIN